MNWLVPRYFSGTDAQSGGSATSPNDRRIFWVSAGLLLGWLIWQCFGVEAMRTPWEDDILYSLAAVNWAQDGHFALPQLGAFLGADVGWRWHMPLFPALLSGWVKIFGDDFLVVRLFSLLPAMFMAGLLAFCCVRLTGRRGGWWHLCWLLVILGDKSFITNSLTGRMEFWCLLAVTGSLYLLLVPGGTGKAVWAGGLLGLATGFHPLAVFFLPGLLWLVATTLTGGTRIRAIRLPAVAGFLLGFALIIIPLLVWLWLGGPLTQMQFLTQVRGTVRAGWLANAAAQFGGLRYNFRFQPLFLPLAAAGLAVHVWNLWRSRVTDARVRRSSLGLLLLFAGFAGFLLQQPAVHLNYYPVFVWVTLLLLASAWPFFSSSSQWLQSIAAILFGILLLNNLLFIAAKTRTVWRNREKLDPAPMNAFLDRELAGVHRCGLPPSLWLYAKQHQLAFRVNFLTVIGQTPETYQNYLGTLLAWQPEVIILDRGDARLRPDRCFTPAQLTSAGYTEDGRFDRIFVDRFNYDGYRLVVYRRH